ncbi:MULTISPECIES: GTPase HflX [unclassified Undibacterium]|uniref:GTPase HflX n=1 Tax=unclassified Undibacterium TaxID=2630295 RepID=UPI002AC93FA7|nr:MULTISPECIES: GTPase HflX [unclassified Undibacterium]MEB0138367.1 GTPase HflX [Undibacterium sp. CCC2.1]MEB0172744.1 GTPase HflX [Undibacterium sp. CCC1.1]MEB0174742.1 GTPase HflX [Undibacterium sp. CCC3.4]MEB0213939.1 GTPase HflX [Undibacterium sp. 5I2]WPX45666.1 GTPase HflX [Undibacterium sp. CCC3.4]
MRAALVGVDFGKGDFAASMEEISLLAQSAGAEPLATVTCKRASPDAALFVGSGKATEIAALVADEALDLVIVNHALSPAQQRNLERHLQVRVVDRTSLILDIFAQRAKSHEGKVQVELAQLQHLATRLIRGWTHLERQKGGIGLRGPGETQLETDRRLIGERVKMLKLKLSKLQRQRETQRRSRDRSKTFSVSLVGYTNAGKSTLFNALTKAGVYAADQLFATLDTTSRRLYLGEAGNVVISDTVGFIRDLPHQLVAAFKATLEETIHADLLLHIVDANSPVRADQIEQVNHVLKEIGADHIPQLMVCNKIDLAMLEPAVLLDEYDKIDRVFLSARTGAGLDLLRQAIAGFAIAKAAEMAPEQVAPDYDDARFNLQ